jgi:hypothetical protein
MTTPQTHHFALELIEHRDNLDEFNMSQKRKQQIAIILKRQKPGYFAKLPGNRSLEVMPNKKVQYSSGGGKGKSFQQTFDKVSDAVKVMEPGSSVRKSIAKALRVADFKGTKDFRQLNTRKPEGKLTMVNSGGLKKPRKRKN